MSSLHPSAHAILESSGLESSQVWLILGFGYSMFLDTHLRAIINALECWQNIQTCRQQMMSSVRGKSWRVARLRAQGFSQTERERDIKRKHLDRAFQPECRAWWRFALVSASCRAWTGATADYEQIKCGSNWILLPVFMILIYNRLEGLDLGKNNKSLPLAFINTQKRSRQRTRDKRKRTFQFIWRRELTESWQKRVLIKSSEVGFTNPPERQLQT